LIRLRRLVLSPITFPIRIALALLALGGNVLYVITNRALSGGVSTDLPVDALIPLWPVWMIPYLAVLVWWIGMLAWVTLRLEEDPFRTVMLAAILNVYTSVLVFVIFPTYVTRPAAPESADLISRMVQWVYTNDKDYNALPSLHISITTVLLLMLWDARPRYRWLWALILLVTLLSTLFTRQHYVLDLVFGFAWGVGATLIARRLTRNLH
jgi:membrane-associated phospholipid phosphatase